MFGPLEDECYDMLPEAHPNSEPGTGRMGYNPDSYLDPEAIERELEADAEAQRMEMLTEWDCGFMYGMGPGDDGCYDGPEDF